MKCVNRRALSWMANRIGNGSASESEWFIRSAYYLVVRNRVTFLFAHIFAVPRSLVRHVNQFSTRSIPFSGRISCLHFARFDRVSHGQRDLTSRLSALLSRSIAKCKYTKLAHNRDLRFVSISNLMGFSNWHCCSRFEWIRRQPSSPIEIR